MKRILCIVSSLDAGGAETFIMKIYRKLDKSKYQLDFCVARKDRGTYEDEIESLGGKIFHICPKSKNFSQYKSDLKAVFTQNSFYGILRFGDNIFNFYDLWIAKKCGIAVRGFRSCNSSSNIGKAKNIVHTLLRRFVSKLANIKIAPSTEAAVYTFGKNNTKKVHILHNGIQYDDFSFNENYRETIRTEFNIQENLVVGHIGRFMKQKNHLFLLKVFAEICKENNNAVLMLVGTGPDEQLIREAVDELKLTDKVIFTGLRKDVGCLLSAMDIFVFPSLYEGMPNTVIEAQANGLHCIISDTITKEANITGLVEYLPLNEDIELWKEKCLSSFYLHQDTTKAFIKAKYDIESVVQNFVEIMFSN